MKGEKESERESEENPIFIVRQSGWDFITGAIQVLLPRFEKMSRKLRAIERLLEAQFGADELHRHRIRTIDKTTVHEREEDDDEDEV